MHSDYVEKFSLFYIYLLLFLFFYFLNYVKKKRHNWHSTNNQDFNRYKIDIKFQKNDTNAECLGLMRICEAKPNKKSDHYFRLGVSFWSLPLDFFGFFLRTLRAALALSLPPPPPPTPTRYTTTTTYIESVHTTSLPPSLHVETTTTIWY